MSSNSFDAKATLSVGDRSYEIFRLDALQAKYDVARLPFSLKILLENLLRNEDGESDPRAGHRGAREVERERSAQRRDRVHARARADAGLHRRARRRRPGGDARRDERHGRRPQQDQSAGPRRARHRPLRAGRRVRHQCRLPAQRRARVRAQPRALRVPALGAESVRQLQGRPARHRHRPPGQPRVPRARRVRQRQPRAGLSGHARRDRLAHDDGQRPRRARLGRRRDRGRGGDARPADVDADPAGDRLQADRRAAGGRDRDRPRADGHRDAAQERRRRQVRGVLRRRAGQPAARRPRHDRQHVARSTARPARSSRSTPRRSATWSSPAVRRS